MIFVFGVGITVVLALLVTYRELRTIVIVREYEAGLLYRHGTFVRQLGPGRYGLWRRHGEITVVDLRTRTVTVPGQELLTADNVGLKVSIVLSYAIAQPETALHGVQNYAEALYVASQLALRSIVAESTIDALLEKRAEVGRRLTAQVAEDAAALGLALHAADVKDVMFPGELKKIFAEVVRAQKEGQAALERARGETAALRCLANAAKMLEDNPALFNLRMLQAIAAPGGAGNSFVVGVPSGVVPVTRRAGQG